MLASNRSRLALTSLAVVTVMVSTAHADITDGQNWMVGPLIGVRISGPPKNRGIFGVEGGYGINLQRVNLGFEHRADTDLFYLELDPWYLIGGTLGLGIDTSGSSQLVVGLWEGIPLRDPGCAAGWSKMVSLAAGYRYTGVHELYVTVKAGTYLGNGLCLD